MDSYGYELEHLESSLKCFFVFLMYLLRYIENEIDT